MTNTGPEPPHVEATNHPVAARQQRLGLRPGHGGTCQRQVGAKGCALDPAHGRQNLGMLELPGQAVRGGQVEQSWHDQVDAGHRADCLDLLERLARFDQQTTDDAILDRFAIAGHGGAPARLRDEGAEAAGAIGWICSSGVGASPSGNQKSTMSFVVGSVMVRPPA